MILVDTSIWIDHLRDGNTQLAELLGRSQVLAHPFVTGELACGNLRNRNGRKGQTLDRRQSPQKSGKQDELGV